MLKITRINHSAIATPAGVDAMRRFYGEILGAPIIKRDIPPEVETVIPGFWMQFENGQVHVIGRGEHTAAMALGGMAGGGDSSANPIGPHVAYFVADLEAAAAHLKSHDLAFNRMGGFIFFTDPAGNTIEFQQDPLLRAVAE